MRNLKSMVAFLVVAAMLFASVTSFAYGDVAADADYATAVEVLSALEILKGDDKGNFNPDNTITRAESAAVIVRLLGLEDEAAGAAGATQFVDVAADHWGSGYINMAAQSGIIAGYGDGNFGPEDAVTYEQFVKMLVCAMGYEPQALVKGTYPTGYLIAAKEMKLTKGVSGAAGQEAPRSTVAELAYNALDIPMMAQTGWGSDISYEVQDAVYENNAVKTEAKTLLSDKLEIYKVEATVGDIADIEKVSLTLSADCDTNKNLAKNGAPEVYANGVSVAGFVGYSVDAYLVDGAKKNTYDLVAIAKNADLTSIVLAAEDIVPSTTAVKYEDEDEDEQTLKYDASTVGYFSNGVSATAPATLDTTAGLTYEFLVDADDEIKTVFVTSYATAIVKEYDARNERIVLKDKNGYTSNYIKLDEDTLEKMTYSLVDANGAAVEPADLTEDAVLLIKESVKDANTSNAKTISIEMIVSTATVEGKITSTSKDAEGKTMYTIGDNKYYLALNPYGDDVKIKAEGTFYLDPQGKIINFEAVESSINLAFVYRAQAVAGTDDYTIKVLDKDGLNTYTLAEATKVETQWQKKDASDNLLYYVDATLPEGTEAGQKDHADNYTTTAGTAGTNVPVIETGKARAGVAYDLVKTIHVFDGADVVEQADLIGNFFEIETNANGVVTKLMPFAMTSNAGNLSVTPDVKYVASQTKLGKFLAEDVVIFNIAAGAELEDLSVSGLTSLVDEKKYDIYELDDDADAKETKVLLITDGGVDAAWEAPIAIVTAVDTVLDAEENEITELTVLTEGKEAKVLTDDAIDVGDVITYVLDGEGKIEAYKHIADIDMKKDNDQTPDNEALNNNVIALTVAAKGATKATDNRIFVYGTVEDINGNNIVTVASNGKDASVDGAAIETIKLEDVDTYIVNYNKKAPFSVGGALDLLENEPNKDDATKSVAHYALFVLDEDENIVSLIIVEPIEGAVQSL